MWGSRGRILIGAVAGALAVTIVAGVGGTEPAGARSRFQVSTRRIGPGIILRKIHDRRIPNDIKVLEVRPEGRPTIDVALANDEIPGHETTSSMARRHNAVAAINGDFTVRPQDAGAGRPIDTFAEDGRLLASPLIYGRNFSISRDETSITFGHDRLSAWVRQDDSGEQWRVRAINPLTAQPDAFSMYTPAGGTVSRSPSYSCSARLRALGDSRWTSGKLGLERTFYVDRFSCRGAPLARRGGIVLAAPVGSKAAAKMQASLLPGENVTYSWSMKRYGILDTIGGNPDLVENGAVATGTCTASYFCRRNPRTGVGRTADGTLLFATVDGRSRTSLGMTPAEFARFFIRLGATWALNLDGGGSTTMVVHDRVINHPSSGYERPVGSALLILSGPDPDELEPGLATPPPTPNPTPTAVWTASPTPTDTGRVPPSGLDDIDGFQGIMPASCGELLDPGSTGGLLDALARGDLRRSKSPLDARLRFAVRVFRGQRACS
jgi:hypothetical protein